MQYPGPIDDSPPSHRTEASLTRWITARIRASGRRVPARALGAGALRQPALDVLEDLLLLQLVEDLVIEARVEAEGPVGCRGTGEEALATRRIDDLIIATVQE